jgi:2'-5' RNA ligase
VTFAFLGEVDGPRVPRLQAGLDEALARCPAPELSLAGGGAFGRSVLWVGVAGDLPALARVAGAAAAAARAARVPVERRPFRAHLTVARVRGDADLGPHRAGLRRYAGPPWTASEAVLYRSHLGPAPRHEVLERFPLATGASAGP